VVHLSGRYFTTLFRELALSPMMGALIEVY